MDEKHEVVLPKMVVSKPNNLNDINKKNSAASSPAGSPRGPVTLQKHEIVLPKMVVSKLNNLNEINNKNSAASSPTGSPRGPVTLQKQSSARMNCLCAPTTHAGSFRCRLHRKPGGLTRNSGSVGSNLCDLASSKSATNRSNLAG